MQTSKSSKQIESNRLTVLFLDFITQVKVTLPTTRTVTMRMTGAPTSTTASSSVPKIECRTSTTMTTTRSRRTLPRVLMSTRMQSRRKLLRVEMCRRRRRIRMMRSRSSRAVGRCVIGHVLVASESLILHSGICGTNIGYRFPGMFDFVM